MRETSPLPNPRTFNEWLVARMYSYASEHKEDARLRRQTLKRSPSSRDALALVAPILQMEQPLNALHQAHQMAFAECEGLTAEWQYELYQITLQSALLAHFPLRAKHWPAMRVLYGRPSSALVTEALCVKSAPDGEYSRYSIVVPIAELKNAVKNRYLKASKTPHVIDRLPVEFEPIITTYLDEVRPHLIARGREAHDFLMTNTRGEPPNYDWLHQRLINWQADFLCVGGRGLQLEGVSPAAVHVYRHIVATHLVKATASFSAAAWRLLDTEKSVEEHYADFLPGDRLALSENHLRIPEEFRP